MIDIVQGCKRDRIRHPGLAKNDLEEEARWAEREAGITSTRSEEKRGGVRTEYQNFDTERKQMSFLVGISRRIKVKRSSSEKTL